MPSLERTKCLLGEFREQINNVPDVVYSLHVGGITQNPGDEEYSGDCDTLTVIGTANDEVRRALLELVPSFVKAQEQNGFTPDYDFPIEVATDIQIKETIAGRGLTVNGSGNLELHGEDIDYEDSLNLELQADYAYWLYMLITNEGILSAGDQERFESDSKEALATIFKFVADKYDYANSTAPLQVEDLRENIFAYGEAANHSYVLSRPQTKSLIYTLETDQLARVEGDGRIIVNKANLINSINTLKRYVTTTTFSQPMRVVPFPEMWKTINHTPEWYAG